MSTTQIFVEQLLIGLLVVVLGYAIVHGDPPAKPADTDKPAAVHITAAVDKPATVNIAAVVNNPPGDDKNIAADTRVTTSTVSKNDTANENGLISKIEFGTLFLAFAYFIGIAYDRISDTLMQDFEKHNRLMVAHKKISDAISTKNNDDQYPIHKIRLNLFRDQPAVVAHESYLRSRIRVTRSLVTLMPLVPLAVLMYKLDYNGPIIRGMVTAIIVGVYLVVLNLKILEIPKGPPKTNSGNEILRKYICEHYTIKDDYRIIIVFGKDDYIREPLTYGFITLTALTFIVASIKFEGYSQGLLYSSAAVVMTLVTGWVCWRISETYNKFLYNHYHNPKDNSNHTGRRQVVIPRRLRDMR